ncbi:class I adenylate-forming enzyme family protein [Burkholderia ubonensis]|uniref:class I adenylate-forming enzyme family protein n=1 Tax=Burkholderia ubonensis TaxID=101571 RepID=UPI000ACCF69D|nr:class I adenylate-forming enzyme family protein [Burkholderia ubonensis]
MAPTFLDEAIAQQAQRFPDKSALVVDGQSTSYEVLERQVDHAARILVALGIRAGDRVGLFASFSPTIVAVYLGCLRIGAITAATHHTLSDDKLIHQLRHAGARVLVTDRIDSLASIADAAALAHVVALASTRERDARLVSFDAIDPSHVALPDRDFSVEQATSIFYTTGSTSAPKGVLVNHRIMMSACAAVTSYLQMGSDDVVMSYSTLASDYGVYNVLMPLYCGGTSVVELKAPESPEDVLAVIEREEVTALHVFPPVIFVLSRAAPAWAPRVKSLRYLSSSGQALHPKHIDKIRAALPNVLFYSNYGMTECKRISFLPPQELLRKPTSVGKPLPGVSVLLVDDNGSPIVEADRPGELWVSAPFTMLEYWAMPDETAAVFAVAPDGQTMLRTGDLFRFDTDGDLHYVARRDDIFVRSAWNVSPRDIEHCLASHPAVAEAIVVPVPDESAGHLPKAFVVLEPGQSVSDGELADYCRQRVDWHMVPIAFEIVGQLPRSQSGKSTRKGLA